MKRKILTALAVVSFVVAVSASSQEPPADRVALPYWAYPVLPAGAAAPVAAPDDGASKHLPGTRASFTVAQIADRFNIADWFPRSHPPMPEVVSHGNKTAAVQACVF